MSIIREILSLAIFKQQPPVLIDIGASGEINEKWKEIAPLSICIAFDADDRDFQVKQEENKGYRRLITFNRIVSTENNEASRFFLTSSPYCSSSLRPDNEKLAPWAFASLFEVEKEIDIPAITLSDSLSQVGVSYVDWFKSDTQGTDLRLYTSLSESISSGISALEFEPGIIDAYTGEDKLHTVMKEMDKGKYWLSSMIVKGTQRVSPGYIQKAGKRTIRNSPCWAEVMYLRVPFQQASERQLLFLFICAWLEKQYGFALEVADLGIINYPSSMFHRCKKATLSKIRYEKIKTPVVIAKRRLNKLLSAFHD